MNKTLDTALVEAMAKLMKFLDPENPGCGVAPEVREAARIYLDTWVLGPLSAAQRYNAGDRSYALLEYIDMLGGPGSGETEIRKQIREGEVRP